MRTEPVAAVARTVDRAGAAARPLLCLLLPLWLMPLGPSALAAQSSDALGPPIPDFAVEIAPLAALSHSLAYQVTAGGAVAGNRVRHGFGLGLGARVGFRIGDAVVLEATMLRVTSDRVIENGSFDIGTGKTTYSRVSAESGNRDYTSFTIGKRYGRLDREHFVWFVGPMWVNFRGDAYPPGDTSPLRLKRREQRGAIFGMRIQKELTQDAVWQFGISDAFYRVPFAEPNLDVPYQQDLQFTATLAWRVW